MVNAPKKPSEDTFGALRTLSAVARAREPARAMGRHPTSSFSRRKTGRVASERGGPPVILPVPPELIASCDE